MNGPGCGVLMHHFLKFLDASFYITCVVTQRADAERICEHWAHHCASDCIT